MRCDDQHKTRDVLARSTLICTCILLCGLLTFCTSGEQEPAASRAADKDEYTGPLPNILDTICLSYHFSTGDSLVYLAESFDSVIAFRSPPLLKVRRETWSLVCDTIDQRGNFYLRWQLEEFEGRESQGSERNVQRERSPWLGRTVYLCIDSLGERRHVFIADDSPAMAPGGPFQPTLLVNLHESCKGMDESWVTPRMTDTLYENGFPPPLRSATFKYRAKGRIDTLGHPSVRFEYVLTGQGSSTTPATHQPMLTTSVIAGFGSTVLRAKDMLPLGLLRTSEIKLTAKVPEGRESKATHFLNSDFRLHKHFRNGRLVEEFATAAPRSN